MATAWKVYYFEIFYEQIKQLASEVKKIKDRDPVGYKNNKKTKLLAKVWHVIKHQIATNPQDSTFHIGDTLPKKYRSYKRVKAGLPARYRLFFRFKSEEGKIVVIWMNDEFSLRKDGSKTDVYTVFLKMLKKEVVPSNWKTLIDKTKDTKKKKAQ